jgi:uracil-DNA glycosylase family 4
MPQNNDIAELITDVKERVLFMQELGVADLNVDPSALSGPDVTMTRKSIADIARAPMTENLRSEISDLTGQRSEIPNLRSEDLKTKHERPAAGSRLSSLPSLKDLSSASSLKAVEVPSQKIEIVPEHADVVETIPEIRTEIGPDCTRCKLSQLGRSKVVNSVGNFNADLMFVGEAPGADEDEQGEPFVGRAGKLLTDIMKAIGFEREDVFIGNINRCRPPKNRAPEPDESVVCKPFLEREIAVVRPKVIVVLGATAAQNLLETKVPIGKLRGHFHDYRGTKVMPTFHPAYLLRDPNKKREVWEDMKKVRDYLNADA